MRITCDKCEYDGDLSEYKFIAPAGWPATCASEIRLCPKCGARNIFHKAEGLENEEIEMKELSQKLASISKSANESLLKEAKKIISKLRSINLRYNNPKLDEFITERQRELFFS